MGAIFLALVTSFNAYETACQPDGSFSLYPDTFSIWSSTGFFQITLGGGHLTFAEAKLVDIVWDIVRSSKTLMRATDTNDNRAWAVAVNYCWRSYRGASSRGT
jgi:hypothetical protein